MIRMEHIDGTVLWEDAAAREKDWATIRAVADRHGLRHDEYIVLDDAQLRQRANDASAKARAATRTVAEKAALVVSEASRLAAAYAEDRRRNPGPVGADFDDRPERRKAPVTADLMAQAIARLGYGDVLAVVDGQVVPRA